MTTLRNILMLGMRCQLRERNESLSLSTSLLDQIMPRDVARIVNQYAFHDDRAISLNMVDNFWDTSYETTDENVTLTVEMTDFECCKECCEGGPCVSINLVVTGGSRMDDEYQGTYTLHAMWNYVLFGHEPDIRDFVARRIYDGSNANAKPSRGRCKEIATELLDDIRDMIIAEPTLRVGSTHPE